MDVHPNVVKVMFIKLIRGEGKLSGGMIYSIGHGRKPIEQFVRELLSFDVLYLCDVRSVPFSRFNPQYNQKMLHKTMEQYHIRYLHLGEQLGGRPSDPSCFDNDKLSYELMAQQDFFLEGISRLKEALQKNLRIAIMCSESDPAVCHRSLLIGKELLKQGISVRHILGENKFILQDNILIKKPKKKP
jgi:uncharacterized protein (DUF488 family)